MTAKEMRQRGWDSVDVVFVTGDAYIDHPSFAMAILGRILEAAGFRVGIVSQPDWQSPRDWRRFGRPRLFFAISAGNMDSMINHYRPTGRYATTTRIRLGAGSACVPIAPRCPTVSERAKPTAASR